MTMNDTLSLALALLTGVLLGAIFFGGLWWTVRKGLSSTPTGALAPRQPATADGLVLAGFYFVARGRWERLLACLLGFVAARLIVTRLTRAVEKPPYWAPEASHAP